MNFWALIPTLIRKIFELKANNAIINGNNGKLSQVLMNLLSNSRDALTGKDIEKLIKIKTYNINSKVIIEISDNGQGWMVKQQYNHKKAGGLWLELNFQFVMQC